MPQHIVRDGFAARSRRTVVVTGTGCRTLSQRAAILIVS